MRFLTATLATLATMIISGCVLFPTSAYKVATGKAHVPIRGRVSSVSDSDLAAAVSTLGSLPIYRIDVTDHDHIVVAMQPVVGDSFQDDVTLIHRANGQWIAEHVTVTP